MGEARASPMTFLQIHITSIFSTFPIIPISSFPKIFFSFFFANYLIYRNFAAAYHKNVE